MKAKPWIPATLIAFLFGAVAPLPAIAEDEHDEPHEEEYEEHEEEDDEEIPFPTQLNTLQFIKEQLPLAVEMLDQVREEEGEEEYQEVLEDFQHRYHDYLMIREGDGQEAASLSLSGARIELRLDAALHDYHHTDLGADEREELVKKVRMLLREQLEQEKRVVTTELKLLERHLEDLRAEKKELEALGEEEIEEELSDILELEEEEDDEDEDDHEDEEEEE
ncbi:MAG: hypothetical protein AAGI48_05350 [Verrucomicrobiota bacterium]